MSRGVGRTQYLAAMARAFFAIEFELVSGERDGGIQDWFQC